MTKTKRACTCGPGEPCFCHLVESDVAEEVRVTRRGDHYDVHVRTKAWTESILLEGLVDAA